MLALHSRQISRGIYLFLLLLPALAGGVLKAQPNLPQYDNYRIRFGFTISGSKTNFQLNPEINEKPNTVVFRFR